MKICFVLPMNGLSGGIFTVFEHASRLRAKGHDVLLVFEQDTFPLPIRQYPGMENVPAVFLKDLATTEPFDFVIATWWETTFTLPTIPARHYAYFVQGRERDFYPPTDHLHPFWVEQSFDEDFLFLTVSKSLQGYLAERGRSATVIPNALNFELFGPDRAAYPRTLKPRILVEGPGDQSIKRVPLAFSILGDLAAEGLDFEVFFLSADRYRRPEWKIDRMFTLVPYGEVPGIYASCDFVIKLSTTESFALPVLEAFASGSTAVVTAFPGHDEYIRHDRNALVVPIDDRAAATAAIRRLCTDPALLARLRTEALHCREQFSWTRSNDLFESTLTTRLRAQPSGSPALSRLAQHRAAYQELKLLIADAQRARPDLEKLDQILVSPSWRIGRAMTWPMRKLKSLLGAAERAS